MKARPTKQLLLTVLALGATALVTQPVTRAHGDVSLAFNGVPAAPTVTFSSAPSWELIPGTGVAQVLDSQRPSYDLFRYGSRYYVYNNGYWYRASQLNRPFVLTDERYVPMAFASVPVNQWRSYPTGWTNPKNPHYSGRHDNGKHMGQKHGKMKH